MARTKKRQVKKKRKSSGLAMKLGATFGAGIGLAILTILLKRWNPRAGDAS